MAKEVKKKFKLPAQGKPKPKAKKTSARDLGKTANEQFKAGDKDKNKLTFKPNMTDSDAAKVIASTIKKKPTGGLKYKSGKAGEKSMRRLARITGV